MDPREPWEAVDRDRTRHFASPGAAMGLRNLPQPRLQERAASAHALPKLPGGPSEQLEPPREADSSRARLTPRPHTRQEAYLMCLNAELTEQAREVS